MNTLARALPVLVILSLSPPLPAATSSADTVKTNFAVLVGTPGTEASTPAAALLVPGTVIPLTESAKAGDEARQQIVQKSLSFTKAADKLWTTFRLDPARRRVEGVTESLLVGRNLDLPVLVDSTVRISVVLLRHDESGATYRVIFRQGDKNLADSTITVARGGRSVVGGMDGERAPYIFLFIEPEGVAGGSPKSPTPEGFTEPVPILKVPPAYPEEAKNEKVQGVVVLELRISETGAVTDIKVLQDPDRRLSAAAIEAVKQWQFKPAKDPAGKPVSVRTAITINFALR
jgi:TonB family protein